MKRALMTGEGSHYYVLLMQFFFVLLWSSGFIAILYGLHYTNPFVFLFYRTAFAAICMLAIALLTKAPWPRNWSVLTKTIITGLLSQFLYLTCYFYALYIGVLPTVLCIILALQPLLTAIIYNVILKQRVSRAKYLGLLIGFMGVFVTVCYDLTTHLMSPLGLLVAIMGLGAITIGSIVQKSNPQMDLRSGSAIQFAVSVPPLFLLSWISGSVRMPLEAPFLLALGWMVLVVSVTANFLYYKLLQTGCAVKVNSLFYLIPAVTATLSYLVFKQAMNLYMITGIVLIITGVLITQRANL